MKFLTYLGVLFGFLLLFLGGGCGIGWMFYTFPSGKLYQLVASNLVAALIGFAILKTLRPDFIRYAVISAIIGGSLLIVFFLGYSGRIVG